MESLSWNANQALSDVLSGDRPGYVMRFLSTCGKAVHEYDMIRPGDEILVGVSGGKDSLALLLALELRRRRMKDGYRLKAVRVEWDEWPLPEDSAAAIAAYAARLDVPYDVIRGDVPDAIRERGLSCYLCSRERRRALLGEAQRLDCRVIALGHHLDDFAETALMNLCRHGKIDPMRPTALFFERYRLIRPLCMIRESAIRTLALRLGLPVSDNPCPVGIDDTRSRYKHELAELAKIDTLVRENLFKATMIHQSEGMNGHP